VQWLELVDMLFYTIFERGSTIENAIDTNCILALFFPDNLGIDDFNIDHFYCH
jgi:hypothetical protein